MGRVRLFPEYERVERVQFAYRYEFFDERFAYGETIAELTRILVSVATVEIFADESDFQVLETKLRSRGMVRSDYEWTPHAAPEAWIRSFMPIYAHDSEGDVLGVTFNYKQDDERYETLFRQCEQFGRTHGLGRKRVHLPHEFAGARALVGDTVVLVSEASANPTTMEWLEGHVTQECVAVPYLLREPSGDLDVFVMPVNADTWVITDFAEASEEQRTVDTVIGTLRDLRQNVVRVPGLERVVYEDVNCVPNYANGLLVNGTAVVPQYSRAEDDVALRVLSELGFRTFGVDARKIAESNAVFHCISSAVPTARVEHSQISPK